MTLSPRAIGPIPLTRGLSIAPCTFPRRVAPWIAVAVILGTCIIPTSPSSAAPPAKRYSVTTRKPDSTGNYLFAPSQKTQQSASDRRYRRSTTIVYPHTYSARTAAPRTYTHRYGAVPPRSQAPTQLYGYSQSPAPSGYTIIYPQPRPTTDARSRLSIPVMPHATPLVPPQPTVAIAQPPEATTQLDTPAPKATPVPPAAKPLPPVPDFPDYGRPVAGSPGYVHPPGNNGAKYMIDVREMAPGDKARDPHTGLVFVVPPM